MKTLMWLCASILGMVLTLIAATGAAQDSSNSLSIGGEILWTYETDG